MTILLIAVVVFTVFPCLADTVCGVDDWIYIGTTWDGWEWNGYKQYGRTMGFWEEPTSCTETVIDGNIKYERTKRLACVNPGYALFTTAEGVANCNIAGKAIPDPYFPGWGLHPCTSVSHLPPHPAGNYGEVTTANSTVKYICDQCPEDPNKTEPGQCGCRKPDTDSNGDGIPDCVGDQNKGIPSC
jgi:hypothetical protein